jgi:hypothetical protein
MSGQEAPMDALDQRLTSYLNGRAEQASAVGPGPDHLAAMIAAGTGHAPSPARRARISVRGTSAVAWALLVIALLAALGLAISAGSDRHSGPAPASPEGTWWLDFAVSGVDDSFGGQGQVGALRFLNGVAFEPGGRFRVASGAGGGCEVVGTWQTQGERLAVDLATGENACEMAGPGPAAREIRQRIARAEGFSLRGVRLTLLDADGNPLLVFDRSTTGNLWPLRPQSLPGRQSLAGRWHLDFEASGIEGSYLLTSGRKRSTTPVGSVIEFGEGTVSGGTGAGGGCDQFEGTYTDADGRFTIDIPVVAGHCGPGPQFPDLEVRERLAATAAREWDGSALRLLDADGALLLLYRRTGIDPP